jgi:hypothetical protein
MMGAGLTAYTAYSNFPTLMTQKQAMASPEMKEFEIIGSSKLENGEMMELKVGEGEKDKILIAKYDGKIYAVGNYCTHFGAPLA